MFYNIFDKKSKNRLKKRYNIIADIFEKNSGILIELKINPEINLWVESLKFGDYLIGNTIIERKSTSDFISSMINKRLKEQISGLKNYENRLLIIEGDMEKTIGKYSKVNPHSIKGQIISLINNHKIPIIFTKNEKETAEYLILLSKQQKQRLETSLHSKIPKTIEEQKQYILESFPNIGPKKAELLIKKFNTLNNIFNANERELQEILKNKAKNFKEILTS